MNDQERRHHANELAEGFTRAAIALAHVDRRRTTLDGGHEGDDMSVFDRMRFAFAGQPKAARYDGDSESTPAREPRCTCGHGQAGHYPTPVDCIAQDCVCTAFEPDQLRGLNSDPTGTAAIRPDKAAQELRDHDKDVRAAEALLERITARLARFGPARPAGDAERALLARGNATAPKVCDSCGDLPLKVESSTVKGNLETPAALCDWCYRWVGTTGRKPTAIEAEQHRRGKNPRIPDSNHANRKGTVA